MASPHVAGLLAYLLSIYPSVTFDPSVSSLVPDTAAYPLGAAGAAATSSFFAVVHANLPNWVSTFLPAPQATLAVPSDAVAPIPITLSPAQLKAAILELSSPGLLTDIPAKTINLLVFNNATQAYGKK